MTSRVPDVLAQSAGRASPLTVALVNLKAKTDNWHELIMPPLGTMCLSSVAKKALGDSVRIAFHDMTLTFEEDRLENDVAEFLERERPDVVGIRGFTCHALEFPLVAKMAKRIRPDSVVIVGGPHASTLSEGLFREPAIDYVCAGEGDDTFVEFLAAVLRGEDPRAVPGLGWLADGKPTFSASRPLIRDLDRLPVPDYSIIDLDRYQGRVSMTGLPSMGRRASMFTSRGCHYQCTYCHDNFGKRVRFRSVQSVVDEMRYLIEERGVTEIQIVDDIFNADEARAIRIFDEIVRRNWKIAIAFPNGLRADIMHEEFVVAAKDAGTYHIILAVESATERIQRMVKKYNKLDRVRESIALCARHDIITATTNMLGFPTETEEEMDATIRFNLESDAHVTWFFLVMPFEGTAIHDLVEKENLPTPTSEQVLGFSSFVDDGYAWFTSTSKAAIQAKITDTYAKFYFSPDRLSRFVAFAERTPMKPILTSFLEHRMRAIGLNSDTVPFAASRPILQRFFGRGAGRVPTSVRDSALAATDSRSGMVAD